MTRPIAVQLYSVRDDMTLDWKATLTRIAEMGYIGVETAGFDYAPSPQAVIDEIQQLGLTVTSAHAPLPTEENMAEQAALMRALGSDRIVAGSTGRDKFGTSADIDLQIATFNAASALAKAHGLRFGLHTHWWEFDQIGDRYAFDILLDGLDDDIFLELDTYWLHTAGVDAVKYVTKMAARTPLLHVKDGPANMDDAMLAVGSGVMDVPGVIAAADSAEWLIVELDRCDTDMLTALAESYDYLVSNGLARGNR